MLHYLKNISETQQDLNFSCFSSKSSGHKILNVKELCGRSDGYRYDSLNDAISYFFSMSYKINRKPNVFKNQITSASFRNFLRLL